MRERDAFYSTPSDLVRFALATNPGSVHGELADGLVMALMIPQVSGLQPSVRLAPAPEPPA